MTTKRVEKDFIGEKEINNSAYYGIQTVRALENFTITGYTISKDLIFGLAVVKKAGAQSNLETGLLEKDIANAIIFACDEIIAGKYIDQFVVDPIQGGAGTSINMNANEVIANIALEKLGANKGEYTIVSPNTHVNMSQSTNDAVPTAGRIAMLLKTEALLKALEALITTFDDKSKEFDGLIKMGRTHLQDAIPIRLGQEFSAYRDVLKRDYTRISAAKELMYAVNMGATAVGTGLNAKPDYIEKVVENLRNISGYPLVLAENLVDATQNTDTYTGMSTAVKVMMTNLSKICNDIRMMASGPRAGLYELVLPSRQAGSSIMPGKVNPVMPEVINQIAFQVIGNDITIGLASEAGQFELNVMAPVMLYNVLQSLEIVKNGVEVFREFCLKDIQANPLVMEEYVNRSVGVVTALNPHIGYEKATIAARRALDSGRPIREIVVELGYLTSEALDVILDSYNMTEIGISGEELLQSNSHKID